MALSLCLPLVGYCQHLSVSDPSNLSASLFLLNRKNIIRKSQTFTKESKWLAMAKQHVFGPQVVKVSPFAVNTDGLAMHAMPWFCASPASAGAAQGTVASAKLTRDNQTKLKTHMHHSSVGCQQARHLLQGCSFILISNLFNEPTMAKCQIQRLQG